MGNFADADLTTDDAAFRAAQDAVRRAERERHARYLREQADAEEARQKAERDRLAAAYPSALSERVYDLAQRLAFDDTAVEIELSYAEVVDFINEALDNATRRENG